VSLTLRLVVTTFTIRSPLFLSNIQHDLHSQCGNHEIKIVHITSCCGNRKSYCKDCLYRYSGYVA